MIGFNFDVLNQTFPQPVFSAFCLNDREGQLREHVMISCSDIFCLHSKWLRPKNSKSFWTSVKTGGRIDVTWLVESLILAMASDSYFKSCTVFCSTSLPPTSTRWFDQHIQAFPYSKVCRRLISATSRIKKRKLGMLRIKPGAAE